MFRFFYLEKVGTVVGVVGVSSWRRGVWKRMGVFLVVVIIDISCKVITYLFTLYDF